MGTMVGEGGRVLGIERHPPLAQRSIASVRRAAPELLERGTVRLMAGNALDEALLDQHGPFDAIHVGAAADDLPQVAFSALHSPNVQGYMTVAGSQVTDASTKAHGDILYHIFREANVSGRSTAQGYRDNGASTAAPLASPRDCSSKQHLPCRCWWTS